MFIASEPIFSAVWVVFLSPCIGFLEVFKDEGMSHNMTITYFCNFPQGTN